jgi:hypothetical protein
MPPVRFGTIAAAVGVAALIGGCGSSGQPSGQVVRAADKTAQSPGYRMSGTGLLSTSRTGNIALALSGSFDRTDGLGSLITTVSILGRRIEIPELLSHLTVYMSARAIPGGTSLTGGRPWVQIDLSRTLGAISASSLPTATDPTQFVDYLRAVSSDATSVGTQTIRGVKTTHYRATVDLRRYPSLVPASRRRAVGRSVKDLEAALGGHTIPLNVWIDGHSLVRRLALSFSECVAKARSTFSLTMDLYDYGPQAKPHIPPASRVYDLTPVFAAGLKHAKLGCA